MRFPNTLIAAALFAASGAAGAVDLSSWTNFKTTTVNTAASLVLMVSLTMQTFLLMLRQARFWRPALRKFAPDRG